MAPATRTSRNTTAAASRTSAETVSVSETTATDLAGALQLQHAKAEERAALAVIKPQAVAAPLGRGVPVALRFPLLVLGSLVLSAAGYQVLGEGEAGGELGSVSRRLGEWWEVGGVLGWKLFELALGWYGQLDGYDISALGLLARGPTLYLLSSFYSISTPTLAASLLIDFLSTYIPFRLLRPLTPTHASPKKLKVPNNEIATDGWVQTLTAALAASVYSVTLFIAYKTFLPRTLALGFDGVRSLEVVYRQDWVTLLPLMTGFGFAVSEFVFTPALVVLPTPQDAINAAFDPASATLWETVVYNFWGFSTRAKTVIRRTAVLMFVSGLHTFVQTWFTLEGVEAWAAAVWSSVWVAAAGLAGGALGLVGAV